MEDVKAISSAGISLRFLAVALSLIFSLAAPCSASLIGPPPSWELPAIPTETVSGHVTANNGFAWDYNYGIGYDGTSVKISVEIDFTGLVTQTLKDLWEQGIESMWNGKYFLVKDELYAIPITFDVTTAGPFNYVVNVVAGPHVSNMTEWDTEDTGNVAAHEFGHMLGLYDEYPGGATDPGGPIIDPASIMGSTADGVTPFSRHFEPFRLWLAGHSPEETFRLERTPEPAAFVMAAAGLALFAVRRNRARPR